jgi:hypothetical protein
LKLAALGRVCLLPLGRGRVFSKKIGTEFIVTIGGKSKNGLVFQDHNFLFSSTTREIKTGEKTVPTLFEFKSRRLNLTKRRNRKANLFGKSG